MGYQPVVKNSELQFPISGRGVILVDDVLYTGRTTRAALDAIVDIGRPKFIKLMVMVDRGWRELPIQADYAAKTIKTLATQNVKVRFHSTDGINEVIVKG
ncbi:MAG: Bifunctional protein PyrR [bacterium ADurb.Bin270]|nr:MAG: Bifunctional protein PyrR [bacterium ADurb.Bin270]